MVQLFHLDLHGTTADVIFDHLPEDADRLPRPMPVGQYAIRAHGVIAYNLGSLLSATILGAASQDRPRLWICADANLWVVLAEDGSVISHSTPTGSTTSTMRATPNGQYVFVADPSDETKFRVYDRSLTLVQTITESDSLTTGTGANDFTPANNFSLYHADDTGALTIRKYLVNGTRSWENQINADSDIFAPTLIDARAPGMLLLDEGRLLMAGYHDSGSGKEAAVVAIDPSTGETLSISRFGSTDGSGNHEASAIVRAPLGGDLYVLGWSDSTAADIEGVDLPGDEAPWLMRLAPTQVG